MRLNMPHAIQELNYKDPLSISRNHIVNQIEVREQKAEDGNLFYTAKVG